MASKQLSTIDVMKNLLAVVLTAFALTGCVTRIKSPTGASYTNLGFTKTFSKLNVQGSTNGNYSVTVENWKSDGAQATALATEALKRIPITSP